MLETYSSEREQKRLLALSAFNILDTLSEKVFDDITELATYIFDMPISSITLVDQSRLWFKSTQGFDATEAPRNNTTFCEHVVFKEDVLVVNNALNDERFCDSPLVTGDLHFRFYAGVALKTSDGYNLGTLCVTDIKPRKVKDHQLKALSQLARQVMVLLESKKKEATIHDLNIALNNEINIVTNITENIPAGVSYWDKNLICQYVNKAFYTLLDLPQAPLFGKRHKEITPKSIANQTKPYVSKALNGERCEFDLTFEVMTKGKCTYHVKYVPDVNKQQEVIGFFSFIIDYSDKRRALESKEILASVFEKVSDAIIMADANFSIESVNKGFTDITGYEEADVIGFMPADLARDQKEKRMLLDVVEAINVTGKWKGDLWLTKKNGAPFYVLITIDVIRDEKGSILFYVTTLKDLTEREKVQDALLSATNMLNRAGELAKVGGWELDIETNQLVWTKETFLIHELDDHKMPTLEEAIEFYLPEARPILMDAMEACKKDNTPYDLELPFISAKSKHLWVRCCGEMVTQNGQPVKISGVIQDITQKKEDGNNRLQVAIEQRNTLIREVHHRIKNNLQGVSGILSNFAQAHPDQAKPLNEANLQLQAVAVIHGLQDEKAKGPVELGGLIQAVKANNEGIWQTKIELEVSKNWRKVNIKNNESVPIALIINELITNATKYQTEENSVQIKLDLEYSGIDNQVNKNDKVIVAISNRGEFTDQPENSLSAMSAQFGLGLVDSLMPKNGASKDCITVNGRVCVTLSFWYPVVTLM